MREMLIDPRLLHRKQTNSLNIIEFPLQMKIKSISPLPGKMLKEFEIFYHSHVIYVNNSCCTRTSCYCTFCRQTSQFSFCYITNSFSPQSMKDILTSSPHNRCQIFSCSKQLNTRPCLFDTTNNQSLRNTTE